MDSAKDTLAGGLPHSEIPGSTIARISPGLFAACHVLHRLSVPRHPPDALTLLDPRKPPRTGAKPHPARRPRMKTLLPDTQTSLRPAAYPPRSHYNSLHNLNNNPTPAFAKRISPSMPRTTEGLSRTRRRDAQAAAVPKLRYQNSDIRYPAFVEGRRRCEPRPSLAWFRHLTSDFQKGGDPAAGSPTATLLRLHPSR